jgi:hypothetical protein
VRASGRASGRRVGRDDDLRERIANSSLIQFLSLSSLQARSILIGHNIRLAPPTSGPPPCLSALNERLSLVEHTPGLTISARRGMFGERNRIRLCSFVS